MNKYDAIVAGAGIWGCTVARVLAESGQRVVVLEKRPAAGGNVRCEIDAETGIEIHKYGSHIFHTHLPEVWQFVNRFTSFNGYQHKVIASYQGRNYFLPLGLSLINKFFGVELKPGEVAEFMKNESHSAAIFDAFFRGYTSKQWGKAPEEIDPSIIKRVPVRANYDVNYFNDYWQGIPSEGYNAMFDRMLDHENIEVRYNTAFTLETTDFMNSTNSVPVFYSGPIDALFGYKFGALPWRTLRFETEKLDVADYQGTSVVNYTEASVPYTRIHEFKHYHPEGKLADSWGFNASKTVIMREYSATWQPGDEPYYPVASAESAALLARYQSEVERFNRQIDESMNRRILVVGGRLGEYRYYDMDKSIETALKTAKEYLASGVSGRARM